jgi:nucleotide-binding universal stress UspA family protein
MSQVTAVLGSKHGDIVRAAASALADVLGLDVQWTQAPAAGEPDRVDRVVAALERDGGVGVLGVNTPAGGCWDVLPRVTQPLLVVPEHASMTLGSLTRVLVPLDGRAETATSVAGMANRLRAGGVEVSAVHVFVPTTVPAFWDQAAHSHASWTTEFLRRNLPVARDLGLRRGEPAKEILAAAAASGIDLLLLGWSQNLIEGKARIVRECLLHGSLPVLLVRTANRASA